MSEAFALIPGPKHAVQLFDSHRTAALAIAQFVRDGLASNERIILVTRLDDWNRAAVHLSREVPLADAIASGRLTVCDSRRTLESVLEDGWPSPALFDRVITPLIVAATRDGSQVRAYGDMVDTLAGDGRYAAAARLEEIWNDLRARIPFTLFCGYSSGHFSHGSSRAPLERIRELHSHECCAPGDLVAADLLEQS